MKRTAIWMGLLLAVLPLCSSFAAEVRMEPALPSAGISATCGQVAGAETLAALEKVIFA